jgi:DNA-binding MarR family transcriptional regulator
VPDNLSANELGAYFALRSAGDRLQQAVTEQLRTYGLTEVQFTILAQLGDRGDGIGMTDLAKAMLVSKSGLTYQAGQLEGRGLVSRVAGTRDERSVVLRMTPEGRALLERVLPEHIALVRELLIDRMSGEELDLLRRVLSRVTGSEQGTVSA